MVKMIMIIIITPKQILIKMKTNEEGTEITERGRTTMTMTMIMIPDQKKYS